MSAPATADDLIKLIQKSGLIDEPKLAAFLEQHQNDGVMDSDAQQLANIMVRDGLLTYFYKEQLLMGKWRGFTIGKYKLLERIGIGGMGQVFLCEHMMMRKRLAVKIMPPARASDPVSLGRFYREARVASGLDHPRIVRTYDIDQDGPLHFLVMEFIDGSSLLEIVKKFGPLSINRACHYVKQACEGLEYAHQRGMIHRDIKPGNIIVDRLGVARLLDMGLARLYQDEQDQLTIKYDDKNVLGTADYVSPEQTKDSRNIDIRADIYGMGATFYFLVAGQPPFPDPNVAEKLVAHQTKKPRPLRELRHDVPPGISKVIEKMMAKSPADRYQTPQEIVTALEVWTRTPAELPPDEWMPRFSPAAAEPQYGLAPAASKKPLRPPLPPRIMERSRPRSSPVLPAPEMSEITYESAATVPVPPPSFAPAATAAPSSAMVDLVSPLGSRPPSTLPALGAASPESETSALMPSEPTPPMGSARAAQPPLPEKPRSTPDIALSPVPKPPDVKSKRPPSSDFVGRSLAELRLPPTPMEGPKPPIPSPPVARLAPQDSPSASPGLGPTTPTPPELSKHPNLRRMISTEPLRPTWAPPKTPTAPLRPPAPTTPKPPSRELLHLPPVEPVRPQKKLLASAPPVYHAPTKLPFFDQPVKTAKPSAISRIIRWIMMVVVAVMIGSAIGAGLWYASMAGWIKFVKP